MVLMIQDFKIQDFFNSVPNLDFLFKNAWGVFKIRYEFGYFSAIQVYSHGPRLYFFQFGAGFGMVFPIQNAWGVFKFGLNSIPFRLIKYMLLIKILYIFNTPSAQISS